MSKAKDLIPRIIDASDKKEAIEVLNDVLAALHLTHKYTDMVKLKDELEEEKENFERILHGYDMSDKTIDDMLNCRLSLNFLFRTITDKFSFEINKTKIYFEENKSTVKADSIKYLKLDQEATEIFNAKSATALKDVIGYAPQMREYTTLYAIAYGLYKELDGLLNSIRQFIDYLASAIKNEQIIKMQDAK